MSQRLNLPYSTQDLFPQESSSHGPSRLSASGPAGGGSYTSLGSAFQFLPNKGQYSQNKFQSFKKMVKRVFKPTTLDFETATWEVLNLIVNPKKMYRAHYYYKHQQVGKSSYTRDDPSFLILLTLFLTISAIAWGLAYSPRFWDILKLIVYMVFIDFYLTGIVIATISWFLINKLFNNSFGFSGFNKYKVNYIEWGFCFDIHCNSFLIIWCLLYLLQFILLPLLTHRRSFFSILLGNTLYFIAIGYYFVITFYGFNALPIINMGTVPQGTSITNNPGKMLQMIIIAIILPLLAIFWLLSICFKFNVAYTMVDTYFN